MIIKPLDDYEMVYDYENHRYILTQDGAKNIPMALEFYGQDIDFYLDDMSENLYQYIYSVANSQNIPFIEFKMACDDTIRPYVKKMLIAQLKYDMASKGNAIANDAFVDKESASSLYDRRVSPNVKTMITRLHFDYAGSFEQNMPENRYERWNY